MRGVVLTPETVAVWQFKEATIPGVHITLCQLGLADVPKLISRHPVVVLKIIRPVAGVGIFPLSVVVMRGNSTPLELLCTSSIADPSGVDPPITVCVNPC